MLTKEETIEDLANAIIDQLPPEGGLLSQQQQKDRIKANLQQMTDALQQRVASALGLLLQNGQRLVEEKSLAPTFLDELAKLTNNQVDLIERPTLQEVYGLSDEGLDGFYAVANQLYRNKLYPEASDILYLLVLLVPDNPLYWHALGHAEFYAQKYDPAIAAYITALAVGSDNLDLYLHIAKCYELLNQPEEAIGILESVMAVAKKAEWQAKVENYLAELKKRLLA